MCKGCQRQFSVTSGTLFAWRKLPIAVYLAAIVLFVNAVKGISALQLGRDLDISYKAAFVLAHKLREAMAAELAAIAVLDFAESFFARLRRAEMGQHHHLAGVYLKRYAQEMAWKETHRGDPNGEQFTILGHLAAAGRPSVDLCGYWQRPDQATVG
jgi:hypothetical protein